MAQYLKPDSALGYVQDPAEIECLKINNLRHTILGCMLGDFDEVGSYVVSPEIKKELIEMEKYIVQSYDNIELCKSVLKLDKQISFMVTFEGNKATLTLVEKMSYEANYALNSGTYSNINEYVLDEVETSGEINRNVIYSRWNIKTNPSQILDIFNCDESVLAKYFGVTRRFKYLLNANKELLKKESELEEIEAQYALDLFQILSHYPKLEKEVINSYKESLQQKKDAVSVKKPFFTKTLNEIIENSIEKNISGLDEKERAEFLAEKRNALLKMNIKREDTLNVEHIEVDENSKETSPSIVKMHVDVIDRPIGELAEEFMQENKKVERRLNGEAEQADTLINRIANRKGAKSVMEELLGVLNEQGVAEFVGVEIKKEENQEKQVTPDASVKQADNKAPAKKPADKADAKKAPAKSASKPAAKKSPAKKPTAPSKEKPKEKPKDIKTDDKNKQGERVFSSILLTGEPNSKHQNPKRTEEEEEQRRLEIEKLVLEEQRRARVVVHGEEEQRRNVRNLNNQVYDEKRVIGETQDSVDDALYTATETNILNP